MRDSRGEDCRRGSFRNALAAVVLVAFLVSSLGAASLMLPGRSSSPVGQVIADNNIPAAGQSIVDSTIPSTSFSLSIMRGWNFITIPVINPVYKASNIGLRTGDVVSQWNSLTQKFDKTYIVGRSPPTMDLPIAASTGYLVFAGANELLNLTGIVPPGPVTRTTVVPSPAGGWEALGFLGLNATRRASEVPGMFTGGKVLTVAVFNASSGAHVSYIVGIPFTDFVIPRGLGVWCFCTSNGTFAYTPSIPPVANFTLAANHLTVTVNASKSFDPDGTIMSYDWAFGDGAVAQGVVATHTYAAPGDYSVTLNVTDETGMIGSHVASARVYDLKPTPMFSFTTNGLTVSFDASGSTDDYGIVSYAWDWGDGSSLTTTSPTSTHTYTLGASATILKPQGKTESIGIESVPYTVFGYVFDPLGNPVFGAAVTVTDVTRGLIWTTSTDFDFGYYMIDISGGGPLPAIFEGYPVWGDTINVTVDHDGMIGWNQGIMGAPGAEVYLWLDVTIGVPSFVVTLTVTDTIGQTASVYHLVPVGGMMSPVANFTISRRSVTVTVNGSNSYDADGTIVSYEWDFGDGVTAGGIAASHTYATWGTWWITLTVTDNDGLTSSLATQVTITDYPGPPDSYWYDLIGMVTDSLANPVVDAAVRVVCLETGAEWFLTTDAYYGYFSVNLGVNWTGFHNGDTIRVEVTKGNLFGWNEGIAWGPGNEAYLWLDVVVYPT